jgi:hypothetical protein
MILPKSRSFRLNSRRRLEAENAMLRYQLIVLQRQLRSYPAVPLFSLCNFGDVQRQFSGALYPAFHYSAETGSSLGLGRQDLALKRRQRAGLGWLRLADAWPLEDAANDDGDLCTARYRYPVDVIPIEPGVGSRGWQAQQHPQPC